LVIEDAAQGLNATYKDRYLGTLGHLGVYSFHETKNFIAGEGGALVINDERFLERAEIIREKGTNRSQFLRGETDLYTWNDVGSYYHPSELVAAFLFAQLEQADAIIRKRWEIFAYYAAAVEPLATAGLLRLPTIPAHCQHNAHMFYVILPDAETRARVLTAMRAAEIGAAFHYVPLHASPMGRQLGYRDGDLPVTERMSASLLRLPCYFELTTAEQDQVVDTLAAALRAG
jgi:dTDP-4-amino-4,6-dideoxygalactose transaminase